MNRWHRWLMISAVALATGCSPSPRGGRSHPHCNFARGMFMSAAMMRSTVVSKLDNAATYHPDAVPHSSFRWGPEQVAPRLREAAAACAVAQADADLGEQAIRELVQRERTRHGIWGERRLDELAETLNRLELLTSGLFGDQPSRRGVVGPPCLVRAWSNLEMLEEAAARTRHWKQMRDRLEGELVVACRAVVSRRDRPRIDNQTTETNEP